MVRKTKEEAGATRAAILDAAEQVFLERGVARATLEQIARRAGVTRGAVYWHFRDKEELLVAMRERVDAPMWEWLGHRREELADDPLTLVREACRRCVRRLRDDATYRNVHAVFLTRCELVGDHNPAFGRSLQFDDDRFAEVVRDFERAAELGLLKPSLAPRTAALTLYTLMHGIYLTWLRAPTRFDVVADGEAMLDLFFDGLR